MSRVRQFPAGSFIHWVEKQALSLRRYLRLSTVAVLDPRALASHLGVQLFTPYDLSELPSSVVNQLLTEDPGSWSAGCVGLPTGQKAILYNPTHANTRTRATLMEELAHVHLKHRESKLLIYPGGITLRTYNKTQEREAYWVGAAALLPLEVLRRSKTNCVLRTDLGLTYGVSLQLVRFRENITHVHLVG